MGAALPWVISGCSGGGKSTLLDALAARGWSVIAEPGRRVTRAEIAKGGSAVPWMDMSAFARQCLDVAAADYAALEPHARPAFLDRGAVDALTALERLGALSVEDEAAVAQCRYAPVVLMAPPWRDLFAQDAERHHGFDEATAEYDALIEAYPRRGYRCVMLPMTSVADRVAFVEDMIAAVAS